MSSGLGRTTRYAASRLALFGQALLLPAILCVCLVPSAWALEIGSVQVDRNVEKIIVKGSGFNGTTNLIVGGVSVPSNIIDDTLQEIPFGPELTSAMKWRGSYKLIVEDAGGSVEFSVYISERVVDPTSPPPPPPGGTTCPCIPGWEASGIPKDNFTWCAFDTDGTQSFTIGPRDAFVISALFDPNDVFFDAGNPGNSTSVCALEENGSYIVAEPLVNQNEYDDCENWLWKNICL